MTDYVIEYLKKRGYIDEEAVRKMLQFRETDLRSVADMVCGRELLQKLSDAIDEGKPVTVYGDYDADGIMAAFILFSAIDRLIGESSREEIKTGTPSCRVHWFINDRFEDGYSITVDSVKKLLSLYPDTKVILTCDNGISAAAAVDYAMENRITVLITDHHEQAVPIRPDCPVVDEKSFRQAEADIAAAVTREDLCGAELARRTAAELYALRGEAERRKEFLDSLYAYSGFATITDTVPMTPANHYVARRGLKVMRSGVGFWKLLAESCGKRYQAVSGETIGFYYGPMINACSRVTGSAQYAFRMLQLYHEGKETECRQAITDLAALNETRKDMCSRDDRAAFRVIEENSMQADHFLFLYGEQFSEGVNGLTAAHLAERYRVPAAVLSPMQTDPSLFKGSARSVEGFDLFEALTSHPEKIAAGGHPMAAGLTVRREDLEEVRTLLIEDVLAWKRAAEEAAEEAEKGEKAAEEAGRREEAEGKEKGTAGKQTGPAAHIPFDFHFKAETLSLRTVEELQRAVRELEPFGPGLEPFRIALQGPVSRLYGLRGKDGQEQHAKFIMAQNAADGSRIEALWWNHISEARARMQTAREFFFIGRPEINEFNGVRSIQFIISELYSR